MIALVVPFGMSTSPAVGEITEPSAVSSSAPYALVETDVGLVILARITASAVVLLTSVVVVGEVN